MYNRNFEALSLDFKLNSEQSPDSVSNETLIDIARKLECLGKTNTDFGLPEPLNKLTEINRIRLQYNKDICMANYTEKVETLNGEQRNFVNGVLEKIEQDNGSLVFLNGPAGRGKTYAYNILLNYIRGQGDVALACASSAIAAMNYPGGRTAHNIFKIPVKEDYLDLSEIQCDVLMNGERADVLRSCKLIIWDEFSMMHRQNFEAVLVMLKKIRRNKVPSAGIVIVCLGDFRQIPPVIQNGTTNDTINASILSSPTWPLFTRFDFTIPVRQSEDSEYAEMLDHIGNGTLKRNENDEVALDLISATISLENLIDFVYTDLKEKGIADTTNSALLSVRNIVVDDINQKKILFLRTDEVTVLSHDTLDGETDSQLEQLGLTEDFLNSMTKPNIPPHVLTVKEGMHCYLLRNLSPDDNLLNNTKMKILKISRQLLTAELLLTGETVLIPRITFVLGMPTKKFIINRKQFPIRCGYCKTFNRSQGDTLKKCGLDLREPPFEHGQLYVGTSRVQNRTTIMALCNAENLTPENHPRTFNVVYHELLLDQPQTNKPPSKRKDRRNQQLSKLLIAQPVNSYRQQFLINHSLKIISIAGDSECLYRTISHFLFDGNQENFAVIRQHIIRELQTNAHLYAAYFAVNNDREEPTIPALIEALRSPGIWGSHMSLTVASNVYRFDYTVLFPTYSLESSEHDGYRNHVFVYDDLRDNIRNYGHCSATQQI